MKRLFFFILMFALSNCQKEDDRCGQIIQKVTQNSVYYFILQTDDYQNRYTDPDLPGIPDDGVRQGSVSKENYDSFQVGEDYCSED